MNLKKGAERDVDESRVPENLKPLIPLVKKWAFKSLDDQDAFVKAMKKSRRDEVGEFARAVDAASDEIRAWGLSLPFIGKHLSEYTDDDRSHPFHTFINMEKCRGAVGWDGQPMEPEVVAMRERSSQELRLDRYKQATQTADEAFRRKDYGEYIQLLSPFEDLLTPTQRTKLSLAKSKPNGATTAWTFRRCGNCDPKSTYLSLSAFRPYLRLHNHPYALRSLFDFCQPALGGRLRASCRCR